MTRTSPGYTSDGSSSDDVDYDKTFETAPSDEAQAKLAQKGGVDFILFMLSKAVDSSNDALEASVNPQDEKPVRDWNYRDILRLPDAERKEWRASCLAELEALRKRGVFELVKRPKDKRIVKNRWVFDVKPDGRKKARLVARGYSQVEGIDYDQIFSPTIRFETVRFILALSALEGWHLSGLDVRNAYTYSDL